jgi:hypothetical protein
MDKLEETSFIEDIGHLCDSIGYRLGIESYKFASPIIASVGTFKIKFVEGFKRGWKEAREGLDDVEEKIINEEI